MLYRATLAVVVFCLCLSVFAGCSDNEKAEEHFEKAGNSVQKAYDHTTNAIKEAVEGVNNAVYD